MHLVLGSRSERGGARRAPTKRVAVKMSSDFFIGLNSFCTSTFLPSKFKSIIGGHSQPFITSNRPKLGIDFGLHLLILATFDPSSNILRVGFHDRPP